MEESQAKEFAAITTTINSQLIGNNNLHTNNNTNANLLSNTSYDLKNDWKFVSIVQFVNIFKNVIAVDPISTSELENSLKYPEIEPLCLNILLKLLMKKALFKPTSKIGENFEIIKFHEMMLKKIHFFYKTYIRYLKKMNGVTDNLKVYELIKKDIEEYKEKKEGERYALNVANLSDNQYEDMDIKNLMIVEFFRRLSGRNPFLKTSLQADKMDIYLNGGEDKEENIEKQIEVDTNNLISTESEDYLTFNELILEDKIEVLFFFCNYALTFSGRASFFRDEIMKDIKDPINSHIINKRIKPLGQDENGDTYYFVTCNKDCRIYKETEDFGISLVVKNYEDLEKFLIKLEPSFSSITSNYNHNENNEENNKELIKNIKENLLLFKENNEEENKRDSNFQRKQQAFEKAKKLNTRQGSEIEKYTNTDYFLMNISDHVITRNQMNQITKTSMVASVSNTQQVKVQTMTEDDKKRIKVEKENLERQKRLEKRNKIYQRHHDKEMGVSQTHVHANAHVHTNRKESKEKDFSRRNKQRGETRREARGTARENNNTYNNRSRSRIKQFNQSSEEEYLSSSESLKSNNINHSLGQSEDEEGDINMQMEGSGSDIILEGNLIYRYTNNQVELDGQWYMSTDTNTREKLSFLFQKTNEYLDCIIKSEDILDSTCGTNFVIKICCSNVFECITINKLQIFEQVLKFLSGEFAGYFMYYGKTIEDRVNLSMSLEDSLVKVTGEGTNNLGNFSIIGYMNFYRENEVLLEKNDINSEIIKLAEFKFTKIYTAFNPNENYRVIKSYQHRRKKMDDDYNF